MIDLEEGRKLSNKYEDFLCLLGYFLEDAYLSKAERDDLKTIKNFVDIPTFDNAMIMNTIDEGREILSLNPFPYEWIKSTANRYPFSKSFESTEADYYEWTKWIVDTLEEEAKKVGKA
jgi:hypothetical protein